MFLLYYSAALAASEVNKLCYITFISSGKHNFAFVLYSTHHVIQYFRGCFLKSLSQGHWSIKYKIAAAEQDIDSYI